MAPTLPSLLWGWVNAKHAGGVPNCIWLARPTPYCWTVDLPQGRAREPLLLLKEGLAALGEALQVLLGLCSPEVDYVSSTGTSQPPFFLLLLP